jgi:hypothetical protein
MKNFDPTPYTLRTVEQLAQLQADATTIVFDAIDRRPPDVDEERWRAALRGLRKFIADGYGAEAERLGWPHDELYRVPPVWARGDLCGVGLLIGDREVVEITPAEIRIKTASSATLAFYRNPEVDYGLFYRERLKLLGGDAHMEEPRLRAVEYVVHFYRSHHDCSLEDAKAAVMAAIKRSAAPWTSSPAGASFPCATSNSYSPAGCPHCHGPRGPLVLHDAGAGLTTTVPVASPAGPRAPACLLASRRRPYDEEGYRPASSDR